MIKDFVPARTSLASGIVIKQHILERNKYPQPQVDTNSIIAKYAKSGSIIWNEPIVTKDLTISGTIAPQWNDYNTGTVENFNGGTAGVFEMFNGTAFAPSGSNIFNLTQSWSELIQNSSGSVNVTHNSQDEFYNGEFSGSVLTVTTQSLHAPFPIENIDFSYTPVIYAPNLYSGNTFINPVLLNDYDSANYQFTQDQFLNTLTVPAQGEILLLDNFRIKSPPYTPTPFAYVKIHKIDNNNINNDVALGQATRLRIKFTMLNNYRTIGDIVKITSYPTYYLYKVQKLDFIYFNEANNYIKDYNVSASLSTTLTLTNGASSYPILNNTSYNPNNFFNTTTGRYSVPQTPNVAINFKLSGTASAVTNDAELNLMIYNTGSGFLEQISGGNLGNGIYFPIVVGTPLKFDFTGSITSYAFPGNNIVPFLLNNNDYYIGNLSITNLKLNFSQTNNWSISTNPTSSVSCSLIIEPYITEPNFYNSDNNALLNSVNDQRENSFALDADYGYGTTPINFNALINGTTTHATVPDSNYTSKKSTLLKYDGSKSTSQFLNIWTPEDAGTYGKLPTVESLKTYIAYCDGIGGWPPERENASSMNVLYLIKADSTVVIPNTSQDSLSIMQQTFQTGERVFISTKNGSISPLDP
jgi:hypothetical protein